MKQTTRSAAALVSTSLIAGGGIAAAVTGLGHQAPAPASSTASASPAPDAALSAAVRELLARSQALHGRLTTTRHELRALDRRVQHQRQVAEHLAATPPQAPAAAAPAPAPAAAPAVHATTRASGATGPAVHATTRASGAAGGEREGGDD